MAKSMGLPPYGHEIMKERVEVMLKRKTGTGGRFSCLNASGSGRKIFLLVAIFIFVQLVGIVLPTPFNFLTSDVSAATLTISSSQMSVTLDDKFPRVIQYTWVSNGAILYGQEDSINQVKINGTAYTPAVSFSKPSSSVANYTLSISSISVTINIQVKVVNNTLEFNVTGITDNGATKVNTFEIPNHNLVSVRSNQTGAAFAGSRMYCKNDGGSGDTFLSVTGTPAVNSAALNYLYAFINTNQLSAGIWSNAVATTTTDNDNERIKKQTVSKSGYYRTGLWSAPWVYKLDGVYYGDPLPSTKVVITPDANGDGVVDWQDGAVAYRSIMNIPQGSEMIPNTVVQRIPFNFASQAQNPFLKMLDETKRIYNATDGLGQFVLIKGYQSEGHDSAHPDYGGNIGRRQGGAADLNYLVNKGADYNARFGVHINAQESYPEAKAFNETLVDIDSRGWDWLEASYIINKRYDGISGNRLARLQQLKNEVPNLDFIYLDVWWNQGWDGRRVAREINSMGWALTSEFPYVLEYDKIWIHWSVDYNYGDPVNGEKWFNSQIARFIGNHLKDTWVARHPLLGGTEIKDYEGWLGNNNFTNFINITFGTNLPTKYMQNFKIIKWTGNTINFENNVTVSNATGTRVITKDGKTILHGTRYLLPWSPASEEKLYHWNSAGGSSTWSLPNSWSGLSQVKLYRLTDTGKQFVQDLPVTNNQITMPSSIAANSAYVVYKNSQTNQVMVWGEGTPVRDPGFNSGNLSQWTVSGSGASVQRNSLGQYECIIGSSTGTTTVSQTITGLSPGTYYASVYVRVDGTRRAYLGVNNYGAGEVYNYTDSSFAYNKVRGDSKRDTKAQRMSVFFDVPAGQTTANIYLKTDAGSATVMFDDVRVVRAQRPANPNNAYATQDFENVPEGIAPFVMRDGAGTDDHRTHLSERHDPYTQKGWNGKAYDDVLNGNWSLKCHEGNAGLMFSTIPQTLRFEGGTTYTVTFKYESQAANVYSFVIGDGTSQLSTTSLPAANTPTVFTKVFTASSSGNSWIGISKTSGVYDFVMDDLEVTVGGTVPVDPDLIPHSQMTATATSYQPGDNPSNAIDDNITTLWHTAWDLSDPLPQSITFSLGGTYNVNKLKYLPRQNGQTNGNITGYKVYVSTNGTVFTQVASGTWANDATEKTVTFTPVSATHVRLEATSGAGGWASAAEINIYKAADTGGIVSGAIYKLTNVNSEKCLNVTGASTADGALIEQRTDTGASSQLWKITDVGDGFYKLEALCSNKALDVPGSSTQDGIQLIQWPYAGTANQQWTIVDTGNGKYRIINRNSGKAVDVSDHSTADGGKVIQWTYNGGNNQLWTLIRVQ